MNLLRAAGVFWDQGIERILNQAIESGAKGILTLDYDSVFEPEDLHRMLELYHANPDVGAICPMQWARSVNKPLWQRLGAADGVQSFPSKEELQSKELIDVDTAHFGLSIIRPEALADIPRPWFHHIPGENGSWDNASGKMDADIAFWLKMRDTKWRTCIATNVVIGHIEEMVTWPDENLNARHQYMFDYWASQRPLDAFGCSDSINDKEL
jgi:cellulose synthase/poly-beta-1,6-N-acetylglucosamine synthase-like glycosyltransferase